MRKIIKESPLSVHSEEAITEKQRAVGGTWEMEELNPFGSLSTFTNRQELYRLP
jgi:hypothetical protein